MNATAPVLAAGLKGDAAGVMKLLGTSHRLPIEIPRP
jgi:hypothetical protein